MESASDQEPGTMPTTLESPPIPTTRRVNVNFSSDTYELLSRIASRKGISMSEVLRQAIALEDYVEQARLEGARVLIDRGGRVNELVLR
jgi:Ribbon-helix-helix protein, copG family